MEAPERAINILMLQVVGESGDTALGLQRIVVVQILLLDASKPTSSQRVTVSERYMGAMGFHIYIWIYREVKKLFPCFLFGFFRS